MLRALDAAPRNLVFPQVCVIRKLSYVISHGKQKLNDSAFPTANLSDEALNAMCSEFEVGVYYGWAQIGDKGSQVYPMVMSLGWNPYYKNEKRSAASIRRMPHMV